MATNCRKQWQLNRYRNRRRQQQPARVCINWSRLIRRQLRVVFCYHCSLFIELRTAVGTAFFAFELNVNQQIIFVRLAPLTFSPPNHFLGPLWPKLPRTFQFASDSNGLVSFTNQIKLFSTYKVCGHSLHSLFLFASHYIIIEKVNWRWIGLCWK